MSKKNILIAVIIFAAGMGMYAFLNRPQGNIEAVPQGQKEAENKKNQEKKTSSENGKTQETSEEESRIQVAFPEPEAEVSSPLIVTGIARGGWYFEADFPVKLFDESGQEMAVAPARAQGEWMTENFVPFVAELKFSANVSGRATIVLERNNPSDLPENSASVRIPVKINPSKSNVKIFLNSRHLPAECANVVAVSRPINKTPAIARATLEELFKGPSDREKTLGYETSINPGVKIERLEINNGIAKVDLSQELEKNVGGSCRVTAIRAQIEETLKQFPTVKSVIISIDGRTEDILQP